LVEFFAIFEIELGIAHIQMNPYFFYNFEKEVNMKFCRLSQVFGILLIVLFINCTNDKKGGSEMADMNDLNIPKYICKKISSDLNLSGKLDDPNWGKAEPIKLVDAIHGGEGKFRTEVRALYDDKYLYVGFFCEDDYIWGTETERDGEIWNEECVEVFLNPANVKHQYYELNVSPKNIIFDTVVLNNRTIEKPFEQFIGFPQWNAETMKTAVHVDGELDKPSAGKSWTAEYAIPFDILFGAPNIPPKSGDIWRAGFFRNDSPKAEQREHYAWVKTEREAFHLPWLFGCFEFE